MQNDMRDRLISLLNVAVGDSNLTYNEVKIVADYLCSNDVVSVVRCKDCKHLFTNEYHEEKPLICCMTMMCGTVKPDYYCWQGERKCDDGKIY